MSMSREERRIYKNLKARPDYFHITPDNKRLYLLVEGGMMELTHVDTFEGMDAEELNLFIQDAFTQMM